MPSYTALFVQSLISALLAIFFALFTVRIIRTVFHFNIIDEIKNGNRAAAIFALGIFLLFGLVFGLLRV